MGNIESSRFGRIEYEDTNIISMPVGIIGFPGLKRYLLIQPDTESIFFWLQSVDDPELAFVVTDPRDFVSDYKVALTEAERVFLKIESENELGVFVLVTVPPGNPRGITANLLAPLIVDHASSRAWQIVLDDVDYDIRHPLIADPAGAREGV